MAYSAAVDVMAALDRAVGARAVAPNAEELALADFCQALFGLNEFIYVE